MLDEKKEPKKKAELKEYTVIKEITLDVVYMVGSTISVEVGSDLEEYLLTHKHVNKHGVSKSN